MASKFYCLDSKQFSTADAVSKLESLADLSSEVLLSRTKI